MCGINGFSFKDRGLINKFSDFTKQRGPDYTDFYIDENISLSHNRLSILDPTNRSNQPYIFKNLILSFNGEIYNYKELSEILMNKGYSIDTTSDTEIIIKLFHFENIQSFSKLKGIFAISIYDKVEKKLYLIRDIVGVKNIYYLYQNNNLFFSSLISPLKSVLKNKELNIKACNNYFNFNRNDSNETFFKNIYQLKPGELLTFCKNKVEKKQILKFKFDSNYSLTKEEIKENIEKIITKQFISDVPVALSLSGGVDSNLIRDILYKHKNFSCYSVFFNIKKSKDYFNYDFYFAKEICRKNKIDLTEVECSSKDFENSLEKVNQICEEPCGNPNSIINFILSNNIQEKVIFTGDGGDEIFGGYDRYRSMYIISILKKFKIFNLFNSKKSKNLNRLKFNNADKFYLSFGEQNLFKNVSDYYFNFKKINEDEVRNNFNFSKLYNLPKLNNLMFRDLETWVVNDICLRNDKIYSNKGIEARVPYLDENLINLFLMYPEFKKYGFFFKNKNILKSIFNKKNGFLKKKYGFNPPFASWIKDEMFLFINEILSKSYYDSNHLINLENVKKLLNLHKQKYFNPYLIWNILNFQIFLKQNKF